MSHSSNETKKKVIAAYKDGNFIVDLAKIFKIHRNTITRWLKTSEEDVESNRKKTPGRGRPGVLKDEQV